MQYEVIRNATHFAPAPPKAFDRSTEEKEGMEGERRSTEDSLRRCMDEGMMAVIKS